MFKLLQICVEGNTGSNGRLAESLGKIVIENGGESFIAHGRFPRESTSNIIKIGNIFDIYFHGLETRFFDRHGLGSRRSTKLLISQILNIKPDIIHLHHLHGYFINIEILFSFLKSAKIPIVWTFHDCWSFTGHCTHFDFVGCNRWKTSCFDCPQKTEYPASFFVDRSNENFDLKNKLFNSVSNLTIVSVSNWLNKIVAESFLGSKRRVIISNGVNTEIFHNRLLFESIRKKFKIEDKFVLLGVASPWSERKGFYDFLQLSTLIPNNVVILLVGLSLKEIKKLPSNIIGVEKTENQQELAGFYSSADLFVNFSVEETFGLTTAEALSCGTPALVYNLTGCPEVVDEKTGFIISKGDFKEVLKVIEEVKDNGKLYYSDFCRARALKYFDQNEMLMNYYNLYLSLLKS